jgi:hypothetical protein
MTLADDLAALIAAREAAKLANWDYESTETVASVADDFIEVHGAELLALMAENARLRAALEEFFEDVDADWTNDNIRPGTFAFRFMHAANKLRAALRGPS